MEVVSIVLLLLLAVVVSGAIARILPVNVPAPLVQIAFGAAIGMAADLRVTLVPELFLLVFLPPLLFIDGWRIPKDELLKDVPVVVELALGLVLTTVVGIGFFIDWLIPAMPLAVAFALAAVVSPTDPIAVSAIAARVPIPRRMMHILEGEALLNDASGLVCLRFAIAAALTGAFSLAEAAVGFVWLASAGIAIGILTTLAITRAKAWVSRRFGEDIGSQVLVSLLIPFIAYIAAEHVHASGILAVVAAGVTMTFAELSRQALPATRMRRNSVWDTLQFALNGIIFVLLGEQLPVILSGARETVKLTNHDNPWWLALYVLAIVAVLATLRFVWVWLSFRLTVLRRGVNDSPLRSPDWRVFAAMSLAGVRGVITLAGVLTLPLTLADGTPFPARDLAIALAAGVIIVSLVAASIGLPLVLRGLALPPEPSKQGEENRARVAAARAAIRAVDAAQHDLAQREDDVDVYTEAATRIMDLYRERIRVRVDGAPELALIQQNERIDRLLRLSAIRAEREEVFRLQRTRAIGSETGRKLTRELDLLEGRLRA
ncbi:Na+/H+ antiporter [Sphingomonas phyllosphaerae]|uniref:Na+/H+ antiporter n=1 Tax=Sphingomonas phyllosphaerae TaxID=257003 RepID=UPI0003B76194|nr:Na+/H+ antiporter [Sphingomonas phyllosphaerae]